MRLLVMVDSHYGSIGGVNMPKAKPTQVIVHRIELQEKERDMLEAYATTQALKNAGIAAAAVGVTAVGYLAYKSIHEEYTGNEPSFYNMLSPEGRNAVREDAKENGHARALWKLFTTPTLKGWNPF